MYGGERDSALVVRWSHLPFHVAFWRNCVPVWFFPDLVGFYFGWVEAAPYECLCDDDREHMSLEVVERDPDHVKVRWCMDLVTFGGRIYRGNTRVVEDYEFWDNGLCVRRAELHHGTELDMKRNKDGYEVCEFGIVNPPGAAPTDNVSPQGMVDTVVDPFGDGRVDLRWQMDVDGVVRASGWNTDVVGWEAQVHILHKIRQPGPFVAFGRASMPYRYYPTRVLVWGLNFEKSVLTFSHWPRKMDEYYVHENRTASIRNLNLPTHTPILSYQFSKKCDEIESPLVFRWLIGVSLTEKEAVDAAHMWLRTGQGASPFQGRT